MRRSTETFINRGLAVVWLTALVLFTGWTMTACTTTGALAPPAAITVAKAEYAFEATYNVAGNAYLAALQADALTPTAKARCKHLLAQAYASLLVARQAQLVGDSTTVNAQAAAITLLVAQVLQLVHAQ